MFRYDEIPLVFSKPPYPDESLIGYLIRLAELHRLQSPTQLLKLIHGKRYAIPSTKHILELSNLVGCNPTNISRLFGFEWRNNDNERVWRIQNEWISKPYFISSRNLALCPYCIKEKSYLRSIWELTFYQACPLHGVNLIKVCHVCKKPIFWTRSKISKCNCGALFVQAPSESSNETDSYISSIIHHILDLPNASIPTLLPETLTNKLTSLSLDGLFKTIWLFGYILHQDNLSDTSLTLLKKQTNASEIIRKFIDLLSNWPYAFFKKLDEHSTNQIKEGLKTDIKLIFGPIHRYFIQDMHSKELAYFRSAYEIHIRRLWKMARKNVPRSLSSQLELPFTGL